MTLDQALRTRSAPDRAPRPAVQRLGLLRASVLACGLALVAGCKSIGAKTYNLDQLHDPVGRHQRVGALTSDLTYLFGVGLFGSLGLNSRKMQDQNPKPIDNPLEECVDVLVALSKFNDTKLRNANIRAELYLGNGNLAKQFKYADQRGSPCVVIQGGDEKEKGEVQIKDLIEGAKAAASIRSNEEWRAERPAQFAVSEDKLVEAVREVLARHES